MFRLPEKVISVLRELSDDPNIQSIWLVGSRANDSSRDNSDWDLLAFSSLPASPTQARTVGVDVIQVGPDGMFLLEGQTTDYLLSFSNWQWQQTGEFTASYSSLKFSSNTGLRPSDIPATFTTTQQAIKLWPNNSFKPMPLHGRNFFR